MTRRLKVLATLAVVVALVAAACETTQADHDAELAVINSERASAGLAPLSSSLQLDMAADEWAQQMRDTCTLAHRPDITADVPAGWTKVAENVGYGTSIQEVHDAFMASPMHAANIVDPQFTHVGVGVVHGMCWGWSNVWVVQIFMRKV